MLKVIPRFTGVHILKEFKGIFKFVFINESQPCLLHQVNLCQQKEERGKKGKEHSEKRFQFILILLLLGPIRQFRLQTVYCRLYMLTIGYAPFQFLEAIWNYKRFKHYCKNLLKKCVLDFKLVYYIGLACSWHPAEFKQISNGIAHKIETKVTHILIVNKDHCFTVRGKHRRNFKYRFHHMRGFFNDDSSWPAFILKCLVLYNGIQ